MTTNPYSLSMKTPLPKPVIDPEVLHPYRHRARDRNETVELRLHLRHLLQKQGFLTKADWERILDWKLATDHGSQRPRIERLLQQNSEDDYRKASKEAFSIIELDNKTTRQRLARLMKLQGVGIGIASAVLALTLPEKFCVIDPRGWRALFGETKNGFSMRDYLHYRSTVQDLAAKLGWSVQETDEALWAYDIEIMVRDKAC